MSILAEQIEELENEINGLNTNPMLSKYIRLLRMQAAINEKILVKLKLHSIDINQIQDILIDEKIVNEDTF